MPRDLTARELAEALDLAVNAVLDEFLANAPQHPESRMATQMSFLLAGLRSLILDRGWTEAAELMEKGFGEMTGRPLQEILWDTAAKVKPTVH